MSLPQASLKNAKRFSSRTSHQIVGVDDAGGPPVPIPNTEVKPCSAEDSALATGCENRKMPTFDSEYFFLYFYSAQESGLSHFMGFCAYITFELIILIYIISSFFMVKNITSNRM